ncbi:hypothetical protein [Methylomonas sp. AM2-LC]|uniref:hypothetical protein n=1 Tax=Methylomonas sp. AM2-LC TaxID=3153301 RepID=UPI003266E4C1
MNLILNKNLLYFNKIINIFDIFSVLIIIIFFSVGIYIIISYDALVWVDIITDDAYYYLGIARNMVENGISSFMPPFKTNGYQPLWLLLLTLTGFIFGTSDLSLVIQLYSLTFLFVAAFTYFSKIQYLIGFNSALSFLAFSNIICGMESVLIPTFFILFINALNWKLRGVFGSFLFLSRLDTLSIIVARDIYYFFIKKQVDLRHYLVIIPMIAVYAAINFYYFNIPVPVSGLSKSVGNHFAENFFIGGYIYLKGLIYPAEVFLIIVVILKLKKYKINELNFLSEIVIATVACFLCLLYYGTLSGWPIWAWYFWATFLINFFITLECIYLIKKLLNDNFSFFNYIYVGVLCLVIFFTLNPAITSMLSRINMAVSAANANSVEETFGSKNLELVNWIHKKQLPENTYFAMGDRAGSFGFFLGNHYRFFHTEGLVSSTEYYKAMSTDKGLDFVDHLDINYWIADRENYLVENDIIGVIEPVQGQSAHIGPYMVCFPKNSIVLDQRYLDASMSFHGNLYFQRYVFDAQQRTICPDAMNQKFLELKNRYGGVAAYSFPYSIKPNSFSYRAIEYFRSIGWIH